MMMGCYLSKWKIRISATKNILDEARQRKRTWAVAGISEG